MVITSPNLNRLFCFVGKSVLLLLVKFIKHNQIFFYLKLDVSTSIRGLHQKKLVLTSSGSWHDGKTMWQESSRMHGSVGSCPRHWMPAVIPVKEGKLRRQVGVPHTMVSYLSLLSPIPLWQNQECEDLKHDSRVSRLVVKLCEEVDTCATVYFGRIAARRCQNGTQS